MPSRDEKARRRAIVQQMADRARAAQEAVRPIAKSRLKDLFDYLDRVLVDEGCAHNLRHTKAFLGAHGLDEGVIVPWLGEYGGYCDCEVLANVGERWDGDETSWERLKE